MPSGGPAPALGPADRSAEGFDRTLVPPMILGAVLNPVNSSIIAVSLVPIGAAFGAPPSQTAWLVSGLYLATAIGQPVVGRLVDLFGSRLLFLVGTSLVGVAGVVGALAPSLTVLVLARVLLGFGTCAGYPAAMSLIRSEADRTGQDSPARILTVLAVSTQTVTVIGPTLGGLLIGLGGWRATLAVNIPLALAGLVLGARRLPRHDRSVVVAGHRGVAALDPAGIVLFAVMLVSLLLVLLHPTPSYAWLLLVTALAAGGLVAVELRAAQPFLDLRVLAGNVALLATYLRVLLAAVVSYSFLYGYTQWLDDARGLTPTQTGLVLLPTFAVGILVAALSGRRPGIRRKLLVGATGQVVVCVVLLGLHGGAGVWLLVLLASVMGLPQGLVSLANQNAVYHQADPERVGSSAGLLRTFLYLGAIVTSAATGRFFPERADTPGLHALALFMLLAAVGFLVLTALDRSLGRVVARGT